MLVYWAFKKIKVNGSIVLAIKDKIQTYNKASNKVTLTAYNKLFTVKV
jgi:hypothetical protein